MKGKRTVESLTFIELIVCLLMDHLHGLVITVTPACTSVWQRIQMSSHMHGGDPFDLSLGHLVNKQLV